MSLSLRSSVIKIGLAAAVVVAATAGTVAGVAAASPLRAAAAAPIDHQLCYTATAGFRHVQPVVLANQFSTFQPTIGKFAIHCNPVVKITPTGTFPINNPNAHLACWNISEPTQPTHVVQVTNQFGTGVLATGQPNLLCLPSWKSLTGPPGMKPHQPPGLSHFTCYPVSLQGGGYQPPSLMLQDEFAPNPVPAQVNPVPQELCLPTQKTVIATGKVYKIINPVMHLLCFQVTPTPFKLAWDENQFGTSAVHITQTKWLCLPSTKKVIG
jgi:hypothetical protein